MLPLAVWRGTLSVPHRVGDIWRLFLGYDQLQFEQGDVVWRGSLAASKRREATTYEIVSGQRKTDNFADTLPLGATWQDKPPLGKDSLAALTEDAAKTQRAPGLGNSLGACFAPSWRSGLLQSPSPHAARVHIAQNARGMCMNNL